METPRCAAEYAAAARRLVRSSADAGKPAMMQERVCRRGRWRECGVSCVFRGSRTARHPHDGGTAIAERGIFSTCAAAHATAARHPTFSANGTTATERRQHEVKCGCPDMAHPMPSRSPTSRRKPTSNFPTPQEHWRRRAWERSLRFRGHFSKWRDLRGSNPPRRFRVASQSCVTLRVLCHLRASAVFDLSAGKRTETKFCCQFLSAKTCAYL